MGASLAGVEFLSRLAIIRCGTFFLLKLNRTRKRKGRSTIDNAT